MGGMGGMMGGMMRIEPDKKRTMTVPCVCLEHGKTDPNPRMKYKIVPIERINNDPRVAQLCGLLGTGQVPQRVRGEAEEVRFASARPIAGAVSPYRPRCTRRNRRR